MRETDRSTAEVLAAVSGIRGMSTDEKRERFAASMGDEIVDGVWVSDLETVRSVRGRIDEKMDVVVSVCQDACEFDNAVGIHIPIAESARQEEMAGGVMSYEQFVDAVSAVGQRIDDGDDVLVHCHAGVNRSVGTVAAALGVRRGLSVSEAIQLVAESRVQANPMRMTRGWIAAYIEGLDSESEIEAVDSIVQHTSRRSKAGRGRGGSSSGKSGGGSYGSVDPGFNSTHPDPDLSDVAGWGSVAEEDGEEEEEEKEDGAFDRVLDRFGR